MTDAERLERIKSNMELYKQRNGTDSVFVGQYVMDIEFMVAQLDTANQRIAELESFRNEVEKFASSEDFGDLYDALDKVRKP